MARKSSSPKRKRASLPIDASQQQSDEADVEENPRPSKRGRSRKNPETEEDAPAEPIKAKKRGRPSLGDKTEQGKKKRGRPAAGKQPEDETTNRRKGRQSVTEEDVEETTSAPRRRGRKPAAPPEVEDEPQRTTPGRKKKPRVSFEQQPEEEQPARTKKRKVGRPSLGEAAPSDTNTQAPSSRGKGRDAAERRSGDEAGEETQRADKSRRRSSQVDLLIADAPSKPDSLPHITSRTRAVSQAVIDAKWTPLTAPSINAATEVLTLATRPIVESMANSQIRRRQTSSALAQIHRKISRMLQRGTPFPPVKPSSTASRGRKSAGHEAELNFESVVDSAAALERQLGPVQGAVELLKREKRKMEEELEKDYQTLRNLEAGAKGETRQRRERLKKMHVLAPEKRVERDGEDLVFDKGGGVPPGMVFKGIGDGELKDLAMQLSGHVESIKTNLQQAEGLAPQLANSSASLRSVLSRHLNAEQFNRVVFG